VIRVIIENILLFLLPTLLYVAYVMVKGRDQPQQSPRQILDDAPLIWLFTAGAIMMIIGLAYFGSHTGGKPGQGYEPPVFRDGQVIPGRKE